MEKYKNIYVINQTRYYTWGNTNHIQINIVVRSIVFDYDIAFSNQLSNR